MIETANAAPFQIVCAGAGGTGKTTVAQKIAEQTGMELVPSCSREVQAEFGVTTEDDQWNLSEDQRWEMQQEISRRTNEMLRKRLDVGQPFISDRSPLDHLCYAIMKSREPMTREWLERYEGEAVQILNRCLVVAYFPLDIFEPPADGFRTHNFVERRNLDILLQGYMHDWRQPRGDGAPPFNLMHMEARSIENRVRHMLECSTTLALEATDTPVTPENAKAVSGQPTGRFN